MGIYGCGMYIFLNVITKSEKPVEDFDEASSAPFCIAWQSAIRCYRTVWRQLKALFEPLFPFFRFKKANYLHQSKKC